MSVSMMSMIRMTAVMTIMMLVYHFDPVSFNPLPDEIFEVISYEDDDEDDDEDDQDDKEDDVDDDTVHHSNPVSFNPLPHEIFEVVTYEDIEDI